MICNIISHFPVLFINQSHQSSYCKPDRILRALKMSIFELHSETNRAAKSTPQKSAYGRARCRWRRNLASMLIDWHILSFLSRHIHHHCSLIICTEKEIFSLYIQLYSVCTSRSYARLFCHNGDEFFISCKRSHSVLWVKSYRCGFIACFLDLDSIRPEWDAC